MANLDAVNALCVTLEAMADEARPEVREEISMALAGFSEPRRNMPVALVRIIEALERGCAADARKGGAK